MAIYNSGSVNIVIGSAGVKGNSTNFSIYVSQGNLFKLNDDNVFYEVADVVNATNLTLTTRYSDSDYQTSRAENIASANSATRIYSDVLTNTPVIQNYVVITASERFTDNGAGVLTGNASPAGSGTIDYDSGSFSITLGTNLTATVNLSASYYSGDSRNSMPYKIVKDFTPNYSLPELSLNDREFNVVFTKAMRKIDSALNTKIYDFSSLSEDHSYSGNVINATVGESVVIGDVCQLASDNKFYKMDASAESTTKGLCAMSTESATTDSSCALLTYGLIRDDSWSWTTGNELYVSLTAGNPTATMPSNTGEMIRIIGYAKSSNHIWFDPDKTYLEVGV